MATQVQQLMSRLRDPEFRSRLGKAYAEVIADAKANASVHDTGLDWWRSIEDKMWHKDGKRTLGTDGGGHKFVDRERDDTRWIPKILEERTDTLLNPKIVAPLELWDEFKVCMEIGEFLVEFERVYELYLNRIEHRVLASRRSALLPACRTHLDVQIMAANLGLNPLLLETIAHFGELKLSIVEIRRSERQGGLEASDFHAEHPTSVVLVEIEGHMSSRALERLLVELVPLIRSQFKSAALLESSRCDDDFGDGLQLPVLHAEDFQKYLNFVFSGIEMAALNKSSKDPFDRRIANAVSALAESDAQRSDSIGLALCVTAIDALLGRKGAEGTKQLADFVAGFLEPTVELRRKAARYVERLYDQRSRVLHGERLNIADAKLRSQARQLAATLLYAVWTHRDCRKKIGEKPETEDQLFKHLRENFVKPGLPDGVPPDELVVTELWRPAE
jgi:hypothetical protein